MKIKYFLALSSIFIFLSGCNTIPNRCCTPHSVIKTPCGMCIKDRCDAACRNCNFNETACKACMVCVSDVGC